MAERPASWYARAIVLSVVIPLRIERRTAYLTERLRAALRFFAPHRDVEVVVVDSGSSRRYRRHIAAACAGGSAVLVKDDAPQRPFAPGRTRNVGAERASGDHVLFYDADLCPQPELLDGIRNWLAQPRERTEFLMIPCIYLTAAATERVAPGGVPPADGVDLSPYFESLLRGENALVRHVAVSTSTVVVNRRYFLELGGNNPIYRGHGCEDFDLLHRLASFQPIGGRPDDYYQDAKDRFPGNYRGFRAYLVHYGLVHLFEGLYTAHLWHERPLHIGYHRRRQRNEALLQEMMRRHDASRSPGPDLPAPWQEGENRSPVPSPEALITSLLEQHGYGVASHFGLFRWQHGLKEATGSPIDKVRKLVLRPQRFFQDSRIAPLRRLARAFSAAAERRSD